MTDAQFVQVRLIRKEHATEMGRIAHRMHKFAREAKLIERKMQAKADSIMLGRGDTVPLASFMPHGYYRNGTIPNNA